MDPCIRKIMSKRLSQQDRKDLLKYSSVSNALPVLGVVSSSSKSSVQKPVRSSVDSPLFFQHSAFQADRSFELFPTVKKPAVTVSTSVKFKPAAPVVESVPSEAAAASAPAAPIIVPTLVTGAKPSKAHVVRPLDCLPFLALDAGNAHPESVCIFFC